MDSPGTKLKTTLTCVGSSEAAWLLFSFPITGRYPAVKALRVHLEEEQQIVFDENLEVEALENQRDTELTAFFSYNEAKAYSQIKTSQFFADSL